MIREDGARLALEGPLTLATVAALAAAGRERVPAASLAKFEEEQEEEA